MKNFANHLLIVLLLSSLLYSQNNSKESKFNVVPTLTSNPTSGTGVGAMGSLLYYPDKKSSPAQGLLGGQYTNTDSYSIAFFNKIYLNDNKWNFITAGGYFFNESEFSISEVNDAIGTTPIPTNQSDAMYDVSGYGFFQRVLYQTFPNVYMGGQLMYISQEYKAKNDSGAYFLTSQGINDNERASIGIMSEYDTRPKNEKIYPRSGYLIDMVYNYFPKTFNDDINFSNFTFNARKYQKGFKSNDVFAMQAYYKTSSKDTPDSALAALGQRNVLRGFPMGQYKARTMTAFQGEYRYQIEKTRFRLAGFGGYAHLSHGSKGTQSGNRDSDNGDYYSGGVGVRYTLQKKQGLDYRIDLVTTNKGEQSIYASINQPF